MSALRRWLSRIPVRRWFARWVELWDRRERAESLAVVRILLPLVIIWDLLQARRLNLVRTLWAPIEEGGLGPASYDTPTIELYTWLGASTDSAQLLVTLTLVAAVSLSLGLFSRSSALVLLLSYAQLEQLSPDADRGVDKLLRNVLCMLVFARAGSTLSLDARWRRGSFVSTELVPAWPRYLIIAQLVLLYFFAGVAKTSANWSFRGGYLALYYVLESPHYARFALSHEVLGRLAPLLQLGAFGTLIWERTAVLLPLLLWLRATRADGTWLHRWVERLRLLPLWVATGVFFHLTLATTLTLGIFPWGCLALYPALAHPDTLRQAVVWLRNRLTGRLPQGKLSGEGDSG